MVSPSKNKVRDRDSQISLTISGCFETNIPALWNAISPLWLQPAAADLRPSPGIIWVKCWTNRRFFSKLKKKKQVWLVFFWIWMDLDRFFWDSPWLWHRFDQQTRCYCSTSSVSKPQVFHDFFHCYLFAICLFHPLPLLASDSQSEQLANSSFFAQPILVGECCWLNLAFDLETLALQSVL